MNAVEFHAKPEVSQLRREYYTRLAAKNAAPLWEVLSSLVTPTPRDKTQAALWRYADMRPLIMEAGELITAEEAERRVLILENPGLRGTSQITQSLYAGLQMIGPGEVAPSHRHVASALRFVIEGEGAYTAVSGERTPMRPGDFILTPSWKYHDHGNDGTGNMVWLDGLDIPIVNFFSTSFAEHHPEKTQPISRPVGAALSQYGMGMIPVEYVSDSASSPVFVYPFERSRNALEKQEAAGSGDAWHGVKMQYANPITGGFPMPTIAAFLQKIPKGFNGLSYRSTDATIYCVAEGSGFTEINGVRLDWERHDIFVVPSWHTVSHHATSASILFSFSDRSAQKALAIWREELLELGEA